MRYSSIVFGLLFTTLAGSVRADVFTNTWVAASGGTWTDADGVRLDPAGGQLQLPPHGWAITNKESK